MQGTKLQRALNVIHKVTNKFNMDRLKNPRAPSQKRSSNQSNGDASSMLKDSALLTQDYIRDMSAPHVRAAQGIIALATQKAVPASLSVEEVYNVALNILASLSITDPGLKAPASQLKLWGVGVFDKGPLNLDKALMNKVVCRPSLKKCLLRFLVRIIIHTGHSIHPRTLWRRFKEKLMIFVERLCKRWDAEDVPLPPNSDLEAKIDALFYRHELQTIVTDERSNLRMIPSDAPAITAMLGHLFDLHLAIRRVLQLQNYHLQKLEVEKHGAEPEPWVSFLSTDTPVAKIYLHLDKIAEILQKHDESIIATSSDRTMYLPAFNKERDRVERFYYFRTLDDRSFDDQIIDMVKIKDKEAALLSCLCKYSLDKA